MNEQPNANYIIQSLSMQLSESNLKVAERDAVIAEQYEKIKGLEEEVENLRKAQIAEMDEDSSK